MNGIEFEKFYKKYNLEFDLYIKPSKYDIGLLYKNITVCWYFKNKQTGERIVNHHHSKEW